MDGYVIYKSDTLKFKDLKDKMIQKGSILILNIKINDLVVKILTMVKRNCNFKFQ